VVQDLLAHERQRRPGAELGSLSKQVSWRLRRAKETTLSGVRLVDKRGIVVATSGTTLGEDLSGDLEVRAALAGEPAVTVKPRDPGNHPMSSPSRRAGVRIFVTTPVVVAGEVEGALVLSRTPREELQVLYKMAPGSLLALTAWALVSTLTGGFYLGFLLTRSLGHVAAETNRIADGSFSSVQGLRDPTRSHVRDVAELASSVAQMSERLQQRLAYISEFASNVSHEFKTPLSTLLGTVELLAEDEDMPAEQRARFLVNAEAELLRLQQLVDGLLLLARAEEGRDQRSLPLRPLLGMFEGDGVSVEGQAEVVLGNETQLRAVIENLVQNARRHGGLPIVIEGFVDGDQTGFRVIDAGTGITEANLARMFDRFFTTERGRGGTGLGLALVRAVVESHGGIVVAASAPGRTTVEVRLPVWDPDP